MVDEDKIIFRVIKGETASFRLLVEEYHERIFRMSMGFVHQTEDAEDITQETFLNAFIYLSEFKGTSAFSTWLYRICANTSCSFMRRKKRRSLADDYERKLLRLSDKLHLNRSSDNPHRILSGKQMEEMIYREINKLPKKQQIALVMSKLQEIPQQEIADMMSMSVHAVESLVQRAKGQLKKRLSEATGRNFS